MDPRDERPYVETKERNLTNVLDEGGHSDLDEYLATGSTVGLRRVTDLFPELAS